MNSIIVIMYVMEYKRKEEIIKHFYEKSFPILVSFEPERKKRLARMICIESVLVIICILYFCNFAMVKSFFESINSSGWFNVFYVLMLICVLAVFMYPCIVSSGFKDDLKNKVMPNVMKSFKSIHHVTGRDIFTSTELMGSSLFSRFNNVETDDSFCGKFDGVNCKISETELALVGDRSSLISFKGVIVEFNFNKKNKCQNYCNNCK